METIIYSGLVEKNKKNYGLLAQRWIQIRNSFQNFYPTGDGTFTIPHFYVISMEEARKISPNSFSWPISVWVSVDQELNVPRNIFWNYHEFSAFIKTLDKVHNEYSLIVTKPKLLRPAMHSMKQNDISIYIGNDVTIVSDKFSNPIAVNNGYLSEHIFPIALVPDVFQKSELPQDCLLKFSLTGNAWVLDGVYSRNYSHINDVVGSSVQEVSDNVLENFCSGFKSGYLSPFQTGHITRASDFFSKLNKPNYFSISQVPEIAFAQGTFFGRMIEHNIRDALANLSEIAEGSDLNEINLNRFKNFNIQAGMANAIFSSDLNEIKKALSEYANSNSWNTPDESPTLYLALKFILYLKAIQIEINGPYFCDVQEATFNKIELISDNFKVNKYFTISGGQFRIVDHSFERVNLRFQIKNLTKEVEIVFGDGKVIKSPAVSTSTLEADFSFKFSENFISGLKELTYNQSSSAGTNQKYAPIEFNQIGDLVTKESGLVICSADKFSNLFSSKF